MSVADIQDRTSHVRVKSKRVRMADVVDRFSPLAVPVKDLVQYVPASDTFRSLQPRPGSEQARKLAERLEREQREGKVRSSIPNLVAVDFETADGEKNTAGFTRPVAAAIYDGAMREPLVLWDAPELSEVPARDRPYVSGGVIDATMRALLIERYSTVGSKRRVGRVKMRKCMEGLIEPTDGTRERKRHLIVAHNGGRFDFLFILEWLRRNKAAYRHSVIHNGRIQRLEVVHIVTGRRWCFVDVGLPMSLAELGSVVGVEKHESPFDLPFDDRETWSTYVAGDVLTLHAGVTAIFQEIERLGGKINPQSVTMASIALGIVRRAHYFAPIERARHMPGCPDTCAVCGRVFCFKGCPGYQVQQDKRHSWKINPRTGLPASVAFDREGDDRIFAERHGLRCPGGPHGCLHSEIREFYIGGRNEVFHLTEGRGPIENVYCYDVSSSYPAAMCDRVPTGRPVIVYGRAEFDTKRQSKKYRERHCGFVEASVHIPEGVQYGPLPVLVDGQIAYPTGDIHGCWTVDELEQIFHPRVGGHIREVYRSIWYPSSRPFSEVIFDLYETKRYAPKKSPQRETAKLCLNASYGKLCELEQREMFEFEEDKGERPMSWDPVRTHMGGRSEDSPWGLVPSHIDRAHVVPQIGAWITSMARVRLFTMMMHVVDLGGRVLMVDTDSVFTDIQLPETSDAAIAYDAPLPGPKDKPEVGSSRLGGWKREYADHDHLKLETYGNKSYQLISDKPFKGEHEVDEVTGNPVCKGTDCKGCARSIVAWKGLEWRYRTAQNVKKLLSGEKLTLVRTMQFKSAIRRDAIELQEIHWGAIPRYEKRAKVPGGNGATKPHNFSAKKKIWKGRLSPTAPQIAHDRGFSVLEAEAYWREQIKLHRRKAANAQVLAGPVESWAETLAVVGAETSTTATNVASIASAKSETKKRRVA